MLLAYISIHICLSSRDKKPEKKEFLEVRGSHTYKKWVHKINDILKSLPVTGSQPGTLNNESIAAFRPNSRTYDVNPGVPVLIYSSQHEKYCGSNWMATNHSLDCLQWWYRWMLLGIMESKSIGKYSINICMVRSKGDQLTAGLMKPTGPLPMARRASLIAVMSEPTTGDEHDVPKTKANSPSIWRAVSNLSRLKAENIEYPDDVVRAKRKQNISRSIPKIQKISFPSPIRSQVRIASCLQSTRSVSESHGEDNSPTFWLLLNCAAVNGGGWFLKKLVTAAFW